MKEIVNVSPSTEKWSLFLNIYIKKLIISTVDNIASQLEPLPFTIGCSLGILGHPLCHALISWLQYAGFQHPPTGKQCDHCMTWPTYSLMACKLKGSST